mmetsp:Transcript_20583/g.56821  ORF Transcript_20583/g.56821 Transcript_20583/m.56821 type:complete len:642 (+) Transcript_20583:2-1927(+)
MFVEPIAHPTSYIMLPAVLKRAKQLASSSNAVVTVSATQRRRQFRSSTAALAPHEKLTHEQLKERRAQKLKAQAFAKDYNERRDAYNAQVKQLRKQYAAEVARHKAEDNAGKQQEQERLTRARLERQRLKNIRSGRNALLQEQRRLEREREFEAFCEQQQIKRNAEIDLYRRAHQKCIDALEEEAPLWMTTPDEVEAAFTKEAEQLLWARPGGVLGAPNPSIDAHFWQHETHTWSMRKTFPLQRDLLLQEIQDQVYDEANLDPNVWTPERTQEAEEIETKARLRADVERVGRKELLRRQQRMIEEDYETAEGEVPKAKPAPDLKFLADQEALEKEGARVLMENPTKFFVFDEDREGEDPSLLTNSSTKDSTNTTEQQQQQPSKGSSSYMGPTRGAPISLRKIGKNPYPLLVGKLDPPDVRSDREKKQQQREERMLEAARQKKAEEMSLELAAEDRLVEDLEPDLDYNEFDAMDEQDTRWTKGLDPDNEEDRKILENTDPLHRYTDEDVDWVKEQMRAQVEYEDSILRMEVETMQQTNLARLEESMGGSVVDRDLKPNSTTEASTVEQELEQLVFSMPYEEVMALSDVDDRYVESGGDMSEEEIAEAAEEIPSLTVDQLKSLLQRDRDYEPVEQEGEAGEGK